MSAERYKRSTLQSSNPVGHLQDTIRKKYAYEFHKKKMKRNVPVKSNLKHPPPLAYPGHLTPFVAWEGGSLMNLVFPRAGHLIITHRGRRIWLLASISCYDALIPHGSINHDGDKPWWVQSERYPIRGGLAEKAKACTSFALYLKVFKNHLYHLQQVRELSIKPCLQTQLPEHNRSYWKVSRGEGIWSPGMDL